MDEYESLLEKTVVPELASKEENINRYKKLLSYIDSRIPSKLYRFRRCTDYNFDSLNRGTMWFSSGDKMNDDFDARISYDLNKINLWLDSCAAEDGGIEPIEALRNNDDIYSKLKKAYPDFIPYISYIRGLSAETIHSMSEALIDSIRNSLVSLLHDETIQMQRRLNFACLTT